VVQFHSRAFLYIRRSNNLNIIYVKSCFSLVKVIPVLLNNDDKSYLKQYFKLFYIELINELKSKIVYIEDDKNPQWKFEFIISVLENRLKELDSSNFTRYHIEEVKAVLLNDIIWLLINIVREIKDKI
jgi:hypothetical protein